MSTQYDLCISCNEERVTNKERQLGSRCMSYRYYHTTKEIRQPGHFRDYCDKIELVHTKMRALEAVFPTEVATRKVILRKKYKTLMLYKQKHAKRHAA